MSESALEFYANKLEKYTTLLQATTKKLRYYAWFRFLSFVFIFLPPFIFGFKHWGVAVFSFFALVLFLFLVKKNIQLDKQKQRYLHLKKILEDELQAFKHKFSHFKNGKEFLDTDHFFSYDLDLFGEGSLFQFLNRASTVGGREKLAGWLIKPPVQKDEIVNRQKAIKELEQLPNWRLHFLANGNLFEETKQMNQEIKSWSGIEFKLNASQKIRHAIWLLPFLTFAAIIPSALGISDTFLVLMAVSQWALLVFSWKRVSQYVDFFGKKSEVLAKYMELLSFIEKREFKSDYLLGLQKKVTTPEKASSLFKQLKSLVKELEYRQNILVGILLNSFLLWDIRCVYKLWRWHGKNHVQLAQWLDVVAEFDALISLANYSYNHKFVYPEIHDGGFTFQTKKLGHPLLKADKRVCNDLEINGWSKVVIVTGANMAGKSTYLRTVGVNLILGRIGAPVCAEKMVLTPISIYTNMRTTDSLLKDESYFFAELKRIKGVLERLENGERIFVILDEMLKGTNSVDKLNGSRALIRKLVELKGVSLIATHDLKLSEMENEFPQRVFNKCFEIKIENNELVFDYLLSDGATKTMNATFLMKKMGII